MYLSNTYIKARFAFLLLVSIVTLSACQTHNVDSAETTVSPTVTKPAQSVTQKPIDENEDPNDMENNPFAFNRM